MDKDILNIIEKSNLPSEVIELIKINIRALSKAEKVIDEQTREIHELLDDKQKLSEVISEQAAFERRMRAMFFDNDKKID